MSSAKQFVFAGLAVFLLSGLASAQTGERVKVVVDQANVMLGDEVLATVDKGTEFDVIRRVGNWVGIRVTVGEKTESGWLKSDQVAPLAAGGMKYGFVAEGGEKTVEVPHLMGYLRARSINDVFGKIQQLAMQVPALALISPQVVAKKLGMEDLKGVNLDGAWGVLFLNPKQFKEPAVAVVPVGDFDALVGAAGAAPVQIQRMGPLALIGASAEACRAVQGALEGMQGVSLEGMRGELEVRGDIDTVMRVARQDIEKGLGGIKMALSQAQQMGGAQMDPEAMGAMLETQLRSLVDLLDQTSEVGLYLTIAEDGLRLGNTILAKENSDLGKWLRELPEPTHQLATALPQEEALMTWSGEFGNKGWTTFYAQMIDGFVDALALPEEAGGQLKELTETLIKGMDGTMAGSVNADENGLTVAYCLGCDGTDAFKEAIRDACKLSVEGEFSEMYKKMGMQLEASFKPASRTKDGVEIDLFTYSVKPPAEAEANPMVQQQMKVMQAIYGDPITYEIAYVGQNVLAVMGKGASAGMDALITKAKSGGGALPDAIKTAQGLFEGKGLFYGTLSFQKAYEAVEAIGGAFVPMLAGNPDGPAMQIPGPPLSVFTGTKGNQVRCELFIPAKPIAAIQVIVMQKMAQMGRQRGGGGEGGNPPPPMTF